tara:strand:- start:51670 stop:52965 length:1296 start_codon:yes stop_codon:yes gene_type:complete
MEEPSSLINVIGVNTSEIDNLAPQFQELIIAAERIAATERILPEIMQWWGKKIKKPLPEFFSIEKTQDLILWIKKQNKRTVVLASGDPLWFGIGRLLLKSFPAKNLTFHPSPTSLQLAFSRLKHPWQATDWISLHGRDPYPLGKLLQKRPDSIGILTDPSRGGAKEVKDFLRSSGLEKNYAFWIFEQLGHLNEKITRILPTDEISDELDPLHLVVLIKENKIAIQEKDLPLFGLEDGVFNQYQDRPGLMTKREIRVQLLSDLELPEKGVIWDICAGVGSIGLEALRIRPELKLLSVDKRAGCEKLIQDNAKLLSVKPNAILEADALNLLKNQHIPKTLNEPNRVLLGGGGNHRSEILLEVLKRIAPSGVIVIPLATLEAIPEIQNVVKTFNCLSSVSQHQSYRGTSIGKGTRLAPVNPVFVFKIKMRGNNN